VLSRLELIEKLAALVPPPGLKLVRYHGVPAPHAAQGSLSVAGVRSKRNTKPVPQRLL
jgi:hypothetical protein